MSNPLQAGQTVSFGQVRIEKLRQIPNSDAVFVGSATHGARGKLSAARSVRVWVNNSGLYVQSNDVAETWLATAIPLTQVAVTEGVQYV